jgi:hypothetical protein
MAHLMRSRNSRFRGLSGVPGLSRNSRFPPLGGNGIGNRERDRERLGCMTGWDKTAAGVAAGRPE